MKNLFTFIGLFAWVSCANTPAAQGPRTQQILQSHLQCAQGHQLRGGAPPDAFEMWCRDEKGINQGPWLLWHLNGELAARGNFRNGLFQGALTLYDVSGQKSQELKLLDGKMHGPFAIYWPHGPLSLSGEFYRNQKKGPFIYFDREGKERKRVALPNSNPQETESDESEGKIPIDIIRAGVRAANLSFEQCYETILRQDRNIKGEASLVFRISLKGYVEKIRFENNKVESPPLLLCVESALARTRFPPPQGGKVTIEIPLRFHPKANFDS